MSVNVGVNWNLLPEEMITDILTRLPAKDVRCYKLVSKRWYSIISQPSFIRYYISRANPPWLILGRNIEFTGTESGSESGVVGGSGSTSTDELAIKLDVSPRPGISALIINPSLIAKNRTVLRYNPGKIIGSSNGLVLCCFQVKPKTLIYSLLLHRDTILFVSNPDTGEWARIPTPPFKHIHMMFTLGFIARVDPENGSLDKFLVVRYQHMVKTNTAMLQCFSSDTGKWVVKDAYYMLPPRNQQHGFIPYWGFEFDGRWFWVEYSVGLITWDVDGDIFKEAETDNDEKAKCRLIPLPTGQERPETTREMMLRRSFGGVVGGTGRGMQYVELFEENDCWFKCWRLEDYKNTVSEWSLLYTLFRVDVPNDMGCGRVVDFNQLRILSRHPPYEPDSVTLCAEGTLLLSFDFRTKMVQGCADLHRLVQECIPVVLPRWPISIPPRLYAMYANEEGNEYLRTQNYKEAIECYTKGIDLYPTAVAYINRAKAYFKVSSFFEAEVDCTRALKIGNSCFEGHALRAIVREDLGNLKGCREDVAVALTWMPMQVTKNICDESLC